MPAQNGIDFNRSGASSEDINAALSANNAANWSEIGFARRPPRSSIGLALATFAGGEIIELRNFQFRRAG